MGSWGTAMFENDIFLDVKSACCDFLEQEIMPHVMEQIVYQKFHEALQDREDAFFVYCAIAEAENEYGKLSASARENALNAIEKKKLYLPASTDSEEVSKEILENIIAFERRLEKKKITRARKEAIHCNWNVGDVYRIQLQGKTAQLAGIAGRYLLVHVLRMFKDQANRFPIVHMLISSGGQCPHSREDVMQAEYIQADYRGQHCFTIRALRSEEFDRYVYIGNYTDLEPPDESFVDPPYYSCPILASCLDRDISFRYSLYIHGVHLPRIEDDLTEEVYGSSYR